MARTIREAKITSPTARRKLKAGRQPHWTTLRAAHSHLGWQRWPDDKAGRWVLRRRRGGEYSQETIGIADDAAPADGVSVLSFEQARMKATELANGDTRPAGRLTVSKAMADYIDRQVALGKPMAGAESAAVVHILPALGKMAVDDLTSHQLQRWLANLAAQPARIRTRADEPQRFKAAPVDEDGVRRRRASANRTFTVLRAALNLAYAEGRVSNADAWGRRLKRFTNVDGARVRYLSIEEASRLINACEPDFRLLVTAALQTGCRYGELTRLTVSDFNPDVGTVVVRRSKSGKPRHVVLTEEGSNFFRRLCAGRAGHQTMLFRPSGERWNPSNQSRPMRMANERAKLTPPVTFHGLRHTWASHAVMNGMPLMVVAKNLGHRDTSMVERHYGHLAPSFITEAVRQSAPRFAVDDASNVEPLVRKPKNKKGSVGTVHY
jgi:integrase